MNRARFASAVAILLAALTPAVHAATGAAVLALPLSVRQIGMGGVSVGGADLLRAWSNPALLAGQSRRGEVTLGGVSTGVGERTLGAGVGWMLTPKWTLGLMAMSYSFGFDELDDTGTSTGLNLGRAVRSGGILAAVKLGAVAVGAAVHGISDEVTGDTAGTVTGDAGVSLNLGGLTAALALRNVGNDLRPASLTLLDADSVPREIRGAAAYRYAPLHVMVGAEYASVTGTDPRIGFGAEWWPAAALGVRAGAADLTGGSMHLTLGLSAVLGSYGLDYALGSDAVGLAHHASLTYAFGPTAGELAARVPEPVVLAPPPVVQPTPEPIVESVPQVALKRINIAVASFDPQGVSASDAAVIADMFRSEMVKEGSFDVVEKANMDKLLAEQAFQQTGCTTQECAVRLGKVLNVKYLVVGSFGKLMDKYILSFRMVEIESTRIIYSDDARALSTQEDVTKAIIGMARRMGKAVTHR